MNLALNVWALHAYMLDGEAKYRDWLLEYADGWLERTRANDNIVPANIGLDGTLGGSYGGRWWRGVFGWAHTCERPYFRHNCAFPDRVTYGWANALYLTGDRAYVEVWRDVIDAVNSHAKAGPRPDPLSAHARRRRLVRVRAHAVEPGRAGAVLLDARPA